jgi:DNA-directed RNA polymerase subunit beta'
VPICKPAIVIKGKDGEIAKLARGGDARFQLSVDAILSVEPGAKVKPGRRARACPA